MAAKAVRIASGDTTYLPITTSDLVQMNGTTQSLTTYINNIKETEMIFGYIRVSSDKQTVENQRYEINNFCKLNNLSVDDWIAETISGTKNYDKRQLIFHPILLQPY